MKINDNKINKIRPMTSAEIKEMFKNDYYDQIKGKTIFCVEFEDGSVMYPGAKCVESMIAESCLINFLSQSILSKNKKMN